MENSKKMKILVNKEDYKYIQESLKSGEVLKEDLNRWFKEKWVDVSKKVKGKHPPCGRKKAEDGSYPKCRPSKKVSKETPKTAGSYSKKEKKSMTSQKRRAEKTHSKSGTGNKPELTRYVNEAFDVEPHEYKKILQTKNYILVVPFTHTASCKYGANTKWCTTKRHDDEDFEDHVSTGLLAYLIIRTPELRHKLGNSKFAFFRYKGGEPLQTGLVYGEMNDEHPMVWFKRLMEENDLMDDYHEITNAFDKFYKIYDNMGRTPIEENKLNKLILEELNKFKRVIYEDEYGSVEETDFIADDLLNEAEYQGRKVQLGKIMQGDIKKFRVYVKNDKGKVVKVNFGFGGKSAHGKRMVIKKNNPERRKSFRARMNCDNPGPRYRPRYWSCRAW
jgi:hypothetical protein